jgi:hypothetical protein
MNGSIIAALLFATMLGFSGYRVGISSASRVGARRPQPLLVSKSVSYVGAELPAWGVVNGWPFMRAKSQTLAPCSGVRLYNARPRVVSWRAASSKRPRAGLSDFAGNFCPVVNLHANGASYLH